VLRSSYIALMRRSGSSLMALDLKWVHSLTVFNNVKDPAQVQKTSKMCVVWHPHLA
jgi:hypothetical protein